MPKIHILTEDLISKIAAGEVIDRPAAVIKELMENSLDAKADQIEVSLKDAGKTLIRVKDNGTGIEKVDLKKVFLRHSTSKIKTLEDLNAIHSLGFRGEALYSIGAIADVTLKSKTIDQDSGWEIHFRGGQELNVRPVQMAVGTDIEIRELFFNTPARKKFLKTNSTEINQILNVFLPYVLFYPQCRFLLTHNSKELVDLAPTPRLVDRIAHALNLDEKHLIEVSDDFPLENISVRSVLGDINIKRPRRDLQFIFINGRPVQNKSLGYHLNALYRLLFPAEVFPFFALYITVPADSLDVNIHPTKREVKIKDEQNLSLLVRALCESALMNQGQPKQASLSAPATSSEDIFASRRGNFLDSPSSNIFNDPQELTGNKHLKDYASQHYAFQNQFAYSPQTNSAPAAQSENLQHRLAQAHFVGSFMKKFLFFENGNSLLVVDQHAAQERIMFETFRKQMDSGSIEVQHLLSPILFRVTPVERQSWEEAKEKLEQIGLTTTLFDRETIACHTQPQLIKDMEIAVRNLLAGENIARCDYDTIARRACKASIRAGDYLSKPQAENQRDQLILCADPFTCPHGRPTVIEMTEGFLDKQFLRT